MGSDYHSALKVAKTATRERHKKEQDRRSGRRVGASTDTTENPPSVIDEDTIHFYLPLTSLPLTPLPLSRSSRPYPHPFPD
jgi:hypothetical protein